MTRRLRRIAPVGLAALFIGSGTLHLVRPAVFAKAVPTGLPVPRAIIAISGIAELACGAGLLLRRRWAGPSSAALLVAIFPGNVAMALAAAADPESSRLERAAMWTRLPLQAPLVWAALQSTPGAGSARRGSGTLITSGESGRHDRAAGRPA